MIWRVEKLHFCILEHMIKFIEEIIKWFKLSPLYDLFGKRSFSQSGEDMVVDSILGRPKKGFYVDIGAFHPKIFSNTYLFYKRGWRGICVEPNPEAKWKFGLVRPRDVFVNVGVSLFTSDSDQSNFSARLAPSTGASLRQNSTAPASVRKNNNNPEQLQYFVFEEGAVNTFSAKQAEENKKVGRKLIKVIKIPVRSMQGILDEYLPKGQKIDILNVDVEGMDLAVLQSNNWKKYRPKIIIAEDMLCHSELDSESRKSWMPDQVRHDREGNDNVAGYLEKLGYKLVGMTGYSLIFRFVG